MTTVRTRTAIVGALVVLLTACSDHVDCQPCPGAAVILLDQLQPRPVKRRMCVNAHCGPTTVVPPDQSALAVGRGDGPQVTIVLHLFDAAGRDRIYTINNLTLLPRGTSNCDCNTIELVPGPDGTLEQTPN
jgi:hypothetical protein